MTETAFLQYTGYVLAFFAVWIVARCARSMLSERYVPEVWGYLELPDGTSRAIEHWECILGRAKASDIVLTGEGIERSHAAIQRSGAGEWTLSALDGGRGVWLNGKAVTGDAPLRGGDTIKLGEMELHFLALDDAQRATLQRKRPLTGHKVQPAVTLLLLVCFQLVLLFQFFFTTDGAALAYIVLSFGLLFAMEWFCYFVMRSISVRGFEPETLAFFLTTMGVCVVSSSSPSALKKEMLAIFAGIAVFLILGWFLRDLERAKKLRYVAAAAGIALLVFNVLFGIEKYGAKNWVEIGPVSFQPSELVKLCFVFAGASTLQRLMTRRNLLLYIVYSAAICGCLALINDFGTAIIFFVTFLVTAFMRSGDFATIGLACAGTGFAGVLVLRFKPYALRRFSTWRHVWENALTSGYSQTRAMMCIASGGLFGLGGGRGWLKYVAAADTDLVFAFVSEEWGLLLGLMMIAAIVLLAAFVVRSAPVERSSFYSISAVSAVTIMVVQAMLNVFGTVDLLPLTGVTFPFVSNGGSSMLCVWGLLAFIKAADTRQNASFSVRLPSQKEVDA